MALFWLSIGLGVSGIAALFAGAIGPGIALLVLAVICGYLVEVPVKRQ